MRTTNPSQNAERHLRAGKMLSPPVLLGLRVLAKTCARCGTLVTTPDAQIKMGTKRVQCPVCLTRRSREFWAAHADDQPLRESYAERHVTALKRLNDQTRAVASNSGKEWTGAELEVVDRRDLSATEVASLLGRSRSAVKRRRNLLNNGRTPRV